jgi:hypothetical protein
MSIEKHLDKYFNVSNKEDVAELVVDAAEASPLDSATYSDAAISRDASMFQLEKFTTEAKALTAERLSLGTRAADKKRRAEIDEELQVIRGNSEALRFCLDIEKDLRTRRDDRVTLRTETAAAASAPLQQQPVKAKGFKMPDVKLFPPWSTMGRGEPLDLRRWFLGAERVCETHRLEVSEWGRVVALILPTGVHQDWL